MDRKIQIMVTTALLVALAFQLAELVAPHVANVLIGRDAKSLVEAG